MDFKEYMEYRADQGCKLGVMAFDLLDDNSVPFDSSDEIIFSHVEDYFKENVLKQRWQVLKSDYMKQLS